ncbi:MAG: hypothetical protein LQ338_002082 [Usnochroma carphineum]|nr:MAG: hypothetical protein LQ338_002082 [Usnochroma carphineum]
MAIANSELLRRIGEGACGSVWAAPIGSENTCAFKRGKGASGRSLYNDYVMHQKVLQTLRAGQSRVQVPDCHKYILADDSTWWDAHSSLFPPDFRRNVLVSERIPPFPQEVRHFITDLYCREPLRPTIKSSESNQDCLIRLYLGRRRLHKSGYKFFSLHNFPLQLDQIEELGLDRALYAKILAKTLAELYWKANVDANDVEFVLAPPRAKQSLQSDGHVVHKTPMTSHCLGEHEIWILDFDCCRDMSLDGAGVKQAVEAFYRNDPYFPRPGSNNPNNQALWDEFKDCFLETSNDILAQESPEARLPALWVDMVEEEGQHRSDRPNPADSLN